MSPDRQKDHVVIIGGGPGGYEAAHVAAQLGADVTVVDSDGLGGSAISILQKNGVAGKVPVTGQDATVQGLQDILAGTQCMTVYKSATQEAAALSELAIALAKGEEGDASGSVKDTEGGRDVPAVLLDPVAVTKENVKDVVADGFTTADKICTSAALQKACEENGVSG